MIAQRPPGAAPAVQAAAEALPLEDGLLRRRHGACSPSTTGRTSRRGLSELRRVARRRIVVAHLDQAGSAPASGSARSTCPRLVAYDDGRAIEGIDWLAAQPAGAEVRGWWRCRRRLSRRLRGGVLAPARAVPRPRGPLRGISTFAALGGAGGARPRPPRGRPRERRLARGARAPAHPARARHRPAADPRRAVIRGAADKDADAVAALWTEAYFDEGEGGRDTPYSRSDSSKQTQAVAVNLLVAEIDAAVYWVVALLAPDAPSRAVAFVGRGRTGSPRRRLCGAPSGRRPRPGRSLRRAGPQRGLVGDLLATPYQRAGHRLYESLGYQRRPERDSTDETGFSRLVFRLDLDLFAFRNRRSRAARPNPSSVVSPLIQLTTAVPTQVLLELAALHAVIK